MDNDDGRWHIQSLGERHRDLDDAVRALRRPATWLSDRQRVQRWAHHLLSDPSVVVLDVQTTGLEQAWAVQIGVTDRDGTVLLDEQVNPLGDITSAATSLHGLSRDLLVEAPTFATLLPDLGRLLAGHRCLAYNAEFDRGVLEREVQRLPTRMRGAAPLLDSCVWEDAMVPYAAWTGLWSAGRRAYRYQSLGGAYDAVDNCRRLLTTVKRMTQPSSKTTYR
ncbi:exonuclease domain-containing protein [Streptomyces sp. NPDC029674]|uniref:3'-5' exonuclease n=1 Tax=Streptomyces sp. NPDC029674 TaxID=3365297 RepID=UPI00384B9504